MTYQSLYYVLDDDGNVKYAPGDEIPRNEAKRQGLIPTEEPKAQAAPARDAAPESKTKDT